MRAILMAPEGAPDRELRNGPGGRVNGRSHIERHGLAVTRGMEDCKEGHEPPQKAASAHAAIIGARPRTGSPAHDHDDGAAPGSPVAGCLCGSATRQKGR